MKKTDLIRLIKESYAEILKEEVQKFNSLNSYISALKKNFVPDRFYIGNKLYTNVEYGSTSGGLPKKGTLDYAVFRNSETPNDEIYIEYYSKTTNRGVVTQNYKFSKIDTGSFGEYSLREERRKEKIAKNNLTKLIKESYKEVLNEIQTPWGKSDTEYPIAPGVNWYNTPGHGGLYITNSTANKQLTPQAIEMGTQYGGGYWYEEDLAYNIPFYEHPEWFIKLVARAGGKTSSKEEMKSTIENYFPEYFKADFIAKAEKKHNTLKSFPASLKEDDKIETEGYVINKFTVAGVTAHPTAGVPTKYIVTAGGNRYGMSVNSLKKHAIKISRDGKVIWER